MSKKLNMQRRNQQAVQIYTEQEIARLLTEQRALIRQECIQALASAMEKNQQFYEKDYRWRDLSQIVMRILTKADCLRGPALAEKLSGEYGAFTDAYNEMLKAWRKFDPIEARQVELDNADMTQAIADAIEIAGTERDPQAEKLRELGKEILQDIDQLQFLNMDAWRRYSTLEPHNQYLAEQAIKLKAAGYKGKTRIAKMYEDLRAINNPTPVQEEALKSLQVQIDCGRAAPFIRKLEERWH